MCVFLCVCAHACVFFCVCVHMHVCVGLYLEEGMEARVESVTLMQRFLAHVKKVYKGRVHSQEPFRL